MPECRRCGKCCLADFIAYVHPEDLERWRNEQREEVRQMREEQRLRLDRIFDKLDTIQKDLANKADRRP